jgi:protein-disulfide isomerase
MQTENSNAKLIITSIIVAALVIAGAIVYQPGKSLAPTSKFGAASELDDDAVLGSADAPVTIVIFGDYECPYCKKAADTAEVRIRKEYVETGKVKLVFRDYPLEFHASARIAAEAAQCALPQGKYWEYHDALFARQSELATLDYVGLAKSLGLNAEEFKSCIDTGTYKNEIEIDRRAGMALGIEGTPASFVNGTLIGGAYPYETYQQVIEAALKSSR